MHDEVMAKSFGSMGAGGAGPRRALVAGIIIQFVIMVSVSFGVDTGSRVGMGYIRISRVPRSRAE